MTRRLSIGSAVVDFAALRIEGDTGARAMEPKVMAVLEQLVRGAPEVVTREELVNGVWANESGGDESLSRAISLLRKAFGDHRGSHAHIETIPRRGYRLVAQVRPIEGRQALRGGRLAPRMLAGAAALILIAAFAILEEPWQPAADVESGRPPSIAVIPFADLSPEQDQSYFADGLSEEILNALTRIPGLQVAGRRSAFAFKGPLVDPVDVGTVLHVSHVLEGSVRKQHDVVRITTRLVDASNGHHLWSQTFDGDLTDIFDLQESISRAIASELQVLLDSAPAVRLAPKLTSNQAAYDAFLQGRELSRRFGGEAKLKAIELLEQAVALDPQFAHAWATLGRANLLAVVTHPERDPAPYVRAAKQAVQRALQLDPTLAMGHYVRALILEYELDFAGAVNAVARAYELDPNQPFLIIRHGYYQALIGQIEAGAELMSAGLRQDPTDAVGLVNLAGATMALGEMEEAERLYRRSVDLGFKPAGLSLAAVVALSGRQDEALELWNALRGALAGRYPDGFDAPELWAAAGRALLTGDARSRTQVAQVLHDYFARPDSRANAYRVGLLLAIGDTETFMKTFLERPFPINASLLYNLWDQRPSSQQLRRHPNFPQFAESIGFVAAWQQHGWPQLCRPFEGSDGSGGQFACR